MALPGAQPREADPDAGEGGEELPPRPAGDELDHHGHGQAEHPDETQGSTPAGSVEQAWVVFVRAVAVRVTRLREIVIGLRHGRSFSVGTVRSLGETADRQSATRRGQRIRQNSQSQEILTVRGT